MKKNNRYYFMINKKSKNGVTIIALVITIIVMTIITGVSITSLKGNEKRNS